MARLRWLVFFESVWSPEILQLVDHPLPAHLKGRERIDYARNKQQAAELLKTLFPTDEDD